MPSGTQNAQAFLIFPAFPRTTLAAMKLGLWCVISVFAPASPLLADANVRIADVGLNGYYSSITAVRVVLTNPSPQPQSIHLQVAATGQNEVTNSVTTEVLLGGLEQRTLELPVEIPAQSTLTATAFSSGTPFGRDKYEDPKRASDRLVVLMCSSDDVCKSAQSQIQFSGTVEDRADKNRGITFEVVHDPRDHWWAYSASIAIVLARPTASLTPAQRDALEGFVRGGGSLVLLESEVADPSFLAAYRTGAPSQNGERVGKGRLFPVAGLRANTLGNVFTGAQLKRILESENSSGWWWSTSFLRDRFALTFVFPKLRWVLVWLAVYILVIGLLNFAVLRRFRRLEFGWISVCGVALIFAAAFYRIGARSRPKDFRLDNLATYRLDARSPLAVADYSLRISAPQRRDLTVSVADSAVFSYSNLSSASETNGQIWVEMNRHGQEAQQREVRLGSPNRIDVSFLKWSYRDFDLHGLRTFPGTVHFVSPNRLRNDTGQRFIEAVYFDNRAYALYALPPLAPGQEIQLDTIKPTRIPLQEEPLAVDPEGPRQTLREALRIGLLGSPEAERVFAGLSDGPTLPVELNVSHQENLRTLILVDLGPE